MSSTLKRIFADEPKSGKGPLGLMPLLRQDEEMTWWRPLIVPFRPLVIIFNMLLRSRGSNLLPLRRPQSPRLVQTNVQEYEITWDESDRPVRVTIHRRVNEV